MKNKEDYTFKVMPWLRKVREENAKETEGMTAKERIDHIEKKAKWLYDSTYLGTSQSVIHVFNEKNAVYHTNKK